MVQVVLPYCKVLVQQAAARSTIVSHGNEVLDVLAQSRRQHSVANAIFWSQPTLQCYTPNFFFKPYNNTLLTGDERPPLALAGGVLTSPLPEPEYDFTSTPYSIVKWKRTAGSNVAKTVVPDGDPITTEIKLSCGAGKLGTFWAFQTAHLGDGGWNKGYGAKQDGYLPKNGAVTVRVRRGQNETPVDSAPAPVDPPALVTSNPTGLTPTQVAATVAAYLAAKQKVSSPPETGEQVSSSVRVSVGNVFSVKLPGDNTPPTFEQKTGTGADGQPTWQKLHTFTSVPSSVGSDDYSDYYVSFAPIGGRLAVSVNTLDLANNAFVYAAKKPNGRFKFIDLQSAPVMVSGVNGGAPVQFGISHLTWEIFGQITSTLSLTDSQAGLGAAYQGANAPFGIASAPFLKPYGYVPPGSYGVLTEARQPAPTVLQYRATVCATSDGREPATLKWLKLNTPRLTNPGTSAFTDYGPCVTHYVERQPQPDFDGAGNNRGSNGSVELNFDIAALDLQDAKNGTSWRTALVKYAPVSFVMGNYLHDETVANSGVTTEEFTRIQGYLAEPKQSTDGFQSSTLTVTVHDPYFRLKEPAGFIDHRYASLETLSPQNPLAIYGHDAIRYILRKTIDDKTADALLVYMPKDWPSIFDVVETQLITGQMPSDDTIAGIPPYTKYVSEWIRSIANDDYAGLYFAGGVPVYGQFDLIVAALAVIDVYDGTDSAGNPFYSSALPDPQLRMAIIKATNAVTTKNDYNSVLVTGRTQNGDTGALEFTGQGLAPAIWKDYSDINKTWERTLLVPPVTGQYKQSFNAELATNIGQKVANAKAATRYTVEMPFTYPTLFWGNKIRIHGARDVGMNGKTLRCLNVVTTGDMVKKRATMVLDVVEVIG